MWKFRALISLLAIAPLTALASDAATSSARFTYEGFLGGVKIGVATANVAIAPDQYAAKLELETAGVAGLVFDWRHASLATGTPTADGEAPFEGLVYRNDNLWKGKNRFIEIAYRDRVAEIAAAEPHPVQDEGRPAVDEALRKDVLDPLSAIIALGQRIEQTGSCAASFAVFDGRRRYQMIVEDEGASEVRKSRYAPFGGETRVCSFVFERVAGFKKDSDKPPTAGAAFIRRAKPDAPLMPVKIAVDSKYGLAVLHLKDVRQIDAELAALAAKKLEVTKPE